MSVAIRTLLALLVMLPPGTFRTLDSVTRKKLCDHNTVASASTHQKSRSGQSIESKFPSHSPVAPYRARSWTDTTFLASSDADRVSESLVDVFFGTSMTLEPIEDRRGQWKSVESAPSLNAHLTARGLLLALGELLV